ncbi:methyltransferase [Planomonospora sp. ID67723]|uniref:methyltransferase n=1 Tax=Planomonospora sp. ID67723 TaxID=2738134 RepID=UPI0018C3E664|nr:methyltransferase [Planomonospora sp. ID67723]MBG0833229.1 methyltransferase [Planomonospora sp. ID67723]
MTAPRTRLAEMLGGYRRTALVHLATRLSLPDLLAGGPRTGTDLAALTGVREDRLHQVLRALTALGLLCQDDEERFALTEVGELLRTDHPETFHGQAVYFGGLSYRAYAGLPESLADGGIAFDHVFGTDYYDHLDRHPDLAEHYHKMIALAPGAAELIGGLFDFTPHRTIVDVGGGNGSLLAEILSLSPASRGVVFDLPLSAAAGEETLVGRGIGDRCEVVSGDFRVSVPPGGDVYILSRVLANWPDETAVKILSNCRDAMGSDSTLLVFELLMPERVREATFAVDGDINALAHFGGAVRTRPQFERLLAESGFRLDEVREVVEGTHWSLLRCTPEAAR